MGASCSAAPRGGVADTHPHPQSEAGGRKSHPSPTKSSRDSVPQLTTFKSGHTNIVLGSTSNSQPPSFTADANATSLGTSGQQAGRSSPSAFAGRMALLSTHHRCSESDYLLLSQLLAAGIVESANPNDKKKTQQQTGASASAVIASSASAISADSQFRQFYGLLCLTHSEGTSSPGSAIKTPGEMAGAFYQREGIEAVLLDSYKKFNSASSGNGDDSDSDGDDDEDGAVETADTSKTIDRNGGVAKTALGLLLLHHSGSAAATSPTPTPSGSRSTHRLDLFTSALSCLLTFISTEEMRSIVKSAEGAVKPSAQLFSAGAPLLTAAEVAFGSSAISLSTADVGAASPNQLAAAPVDPSGIQSTIHSGSPLVVTSESSLRKFASSALAPSATLFPGTAFLKDSKPSAPIAVLEALFEAPPAPYVSIADREILFRCGSTSATKVGNGSSAPMPSSTTAKHKIQLLGAALSIVLTEWYYFMYLYGVLPSLLNGGASSGNNKKQFRRGSDDAKDQVRIPKSVFDKLMKPFFPLSAGSGKAAAVDAVRRLISDPSDSPADGAARAATLFASSILMGEFVSATANSSQSTASLSFGSLVSSALKVQLAYSGGLEHIIAASLKSESGGGGGGVGGDAPYDDLSLHAALQVPAFDLLWLLPKLLGIDAFAGMQTEDKVSSCMMTVMAMAHASGALMIPGLAQASVYQNSALAMPFYSSPSTVAATPTKQNGKSNAVAGDPKDGLQQIASIIGSGDRAFLPTALTSSPAFQNLPLWLPHFPCYALSDSAKTTVLFVEAVLRGQSKLSLQPVHRRDVLQSSTVLLTTAGLSPYGHSVGGVQLSDDPTSSKSHKLSSSKATSRLGALLSSALTDQQRHAAAVIAGLAPPQRTNAFSTYKVFPLFTKDGTGVERGEGHGPRKEFFDGVATMATSPLQAKVDLSAFLHSHGGRAFVLSDKTESSKAFTYQLLSSLVVPSLVASEREEAEDTDGYGTAQPSSILTEEAIAARVKQLLSPLAGGTLVCFFWNSRSTIATTASSTAHRDTILNNTNSFNHHNNSSNGGSKGSAASPPGTGNSRSAIVNSPRAGANNSQQVIVGKDQSICFEPGDTITYKYEDMDDDVGNVDNATDGAPNLLKPHTVVANKTLYFSPQLTVVQLSSRIPASHLAPVNKYSEHLWVQHQAGGGGSQHQPQTPAHALADATLPSILDCSLEPVTSPPFLHDAGQQFAWLNPNTVSDYEDQKATALALVAALNPSAKLDRLLLGGGISASTDSNLAVNQGDVSDAKAKAAKAIKAILKGKKELADSRGIYWTLGWTLGNTIANGCCVAASLPPFLFEMLLPRPRSFIGSSASPTGCASFRGAGIGKYVASVVKSKMVDSHSKRKQSEGPHTHANPTPTPLFISQLALLDPTLLDQALDVCGWSPEELKLVMQAEGLLPESELEQDTEVDDDDDVAAAIKSKAAKVANNVNASPNSKSHGSPKHASPSESQEKLFDHLRNLQAYIALHIVGDRVWGPSTASTTEPAAASTVNQFSSPHRASYASPTKSRNSESTAAAGSTSQAQDISAILFPKSERGGIELLEALVEGFQSSTATASPVLLQCPARVAQRIFCGSAVADDGVSDQFKFGEQFTIIADKELRKLGVGKAFMSLLMDIMDSDFKGTEKRELLKFITGRTLLPPRPLSEHIKLEMPLAPMNGREFDKVLLRLPASHSCGNVIEVPNYLEALLMGSKSPYYTHTNKKAGGLVMDSHKEDAWRLLQSTTTNQAVSKLFLDFVLQIRAEGGYLQDGSSKGQTGLTAMLSVAHALTVNKLRMAVTLSGTYELDDAAVPADLLMDEESMLGGGAILGFNAPNSLMNITGGTISFTHEEALPDALSPTPRGGSISMQTATQPTARQQSNSIPRPPPHLQGAHPTHPMPSFEATGGAPRTPSKDQALNSSMIMNQSSSPMFIAAHSPSFRHNSHARNQSIRLSGGLGSGGGGTILPPSAGALGGANNSSSSHGGGGQGPTSAVIGGIGNLGRVNSVARSPARLEDSLSFASAASASPCRVAVGASPTFSSSYQNTTSNANTTGIMGDFTSPIFKSNGGLHVARPANASATMNPTDGDHLHGMHPTAFDDFGDSTNDTNDNSSIPYVDSVHHTNSTVTGRGHFPVVIKASSGGGGAFGPYQPTNSTSILADNGAFYSNSNTTGGTSFASMSRGGGRLDGSLAMLNGRGETSDADTSVGSRPSQISHSGITTTQRIAQLNSGVPLMPLSTERLPHSIPFNNFSPNVPRRTTVTSGVPNSSGLNESQALRDVPSMSHMPFTSPASVDSSIQSAAHFHSHHGHHGKPSVTRILAQSKHGNDLDDLENELFGGS